MAEKKHVIQKQQKAHLHFAETIGDQLPSFRGVAVVKALSYDLVQILNHIAIQEVANDTDQRPA